VELGKSLANRLLPVIRDRTEPENIDASTAGLIARYRAFRGA
jgi:glucose-6-phosphate isomerase